MRANPSEDNLLLRGHLWVSVTLLAILCLVSFARFRNSPGWDLQPSYVGCRVLASGQAGHLYSQDPESYNFVHDSVWDSNVSTLSNNGKYGGTPYVQTPLWAWLLRPACTRLSWKAFARIFLALSLICTAALVLLVACAWAPTMLAPICMGVLCILLYYSEPFRYGLVLVQTHMLFLLAAIAALILERSNRNGLAGVLLACSAAVKITPAYLLLYWLVRRRWTPALAFCIASALLVVFSALAVGLSTEVAFVHTLTQKANVLLIANNNQSLAAWWAGMHMRPEPYTFHMYSLPGPIRRIGLALSIASALAGGWLDSRPSAKKQAPYGAVFALIGVTVFTPIAWSHYFVLLIVPIMLLADRAISQRKLLYGALALLIVAFNMEAGISVGTHILVHLTRSNFYAALIAMAAMSLCVIAPSRMRT